MTAPNPSALRLHAEGIDQVALRAPVIPMLPVQGVEEALGIAGASWIAPRDRVDAGDWRAITELARQAVVFRLDS